jgi:hypothetical protein
MRCQHQTIVLAPIGDWTDVPIWRCAQCRSPLQDCEHGRQLHDGPTWTCLDCRRILLTAAAVAA